MKKIIFLSEKAGYAGGVERYIATIATALKSAGYYTIYAYMEEARNFAEFSKNFDQVVPFEECDYSAADLITVHKFKNYNFLRDLLNNYRKNMVLFVHDHDYYCPKTHKYSPPPWRKNCELHYSYLRCSLCSMTVKSQRNLNYIWHDYPKLFRLYKEFSQVVVLSQYMKNNLLKNKFKSEQIKIIHPIIQLFELKNVPKDNHLLFVGQLIRGKGVDHFIQLVASLPSEYHAKIIGDGNDKERLIAQANELNLSKRLEFCSWQTNPEDFYFRSEIVIMPTFWQEPFGLVGAEAASCQVPVIAYDSGGTREYLRDQDNGFVIPQGNLDQLCAKTLMLLNDKILQKQMGINGRNLISHEFNQDLFIQKFSDLLQNS